METPNPLQSINVIEVNYLAAVVRNNLDGVLVVDSRSFLEHNTSHVVNSVNVSSSKIIKRRLQQDKLTIKELFAHSCQCEADESCDVIVYDQNSLHTSSVPVDSFLHVLLRKLVPVFRSVHLVQGGFLEFQAAHPSLCEHKTRKSTALTSVSQPCLPVTNLGPTKILPFVYLGSQNDALNKEIVQQYNITYELNVSTSCPKPDFIADSQFMRIPVNDNYSEKLIPHFSAAFQFLDRVRESNACVLIHCLAGISRSATVAIAYVMKHLRMSSDDAYRFVKSKRATISPNFNFLGQLLEFERQLNANFESAISSAPIFNEPNQKKRPFSPDYPTKIRSFSLTIPEVTSFEPSNKIDQSPTTAFAKLSFNVDSDNPDCLNKCPSSLKRRKEDDSDDHDVLNNDSMASGDDNKITDPDQKPCKSLYCTLNYEIQPWKTDISKSQKFDFSSLNTYQYESRKSSLSCSDRRSSSDSLKLDNFDIDVQGIPFSSLSELSFTPCQTSASSSASNSHEGTPERSLGYPRLLNRRAGSESRLFSKYDFFKCDNYDSRSRRSPTPSSMSGCSSQKSSRRGSGTTDDDSDAMIRRYNSSTWYVPSLESIDSLSNSCIGKKCRRTDSICTSGLGSDVSDLSDFLSEVHSVCESLVSDASCSSLASSLCSSSLSRGSSLNGRHDLLRPLSVSSSSEAMMTDNDSDCGEGHLSDVEEEMEEEDESVVFRCERHSQCQDNTKRSSADSAYVSLNEAPATISNLHIDQGCYVKGLHQDHESLNVKADKLSPVSPSEVVFSQDFPPILDSCAMNDSGTKMDHEQFLKMLASDSQDSYGASHDSGISITSQSPQWNEFKDEKNFTLDQVIEDITAEKGDIICSSPVTDNLICGNCNNSDSTHCKYELPSHSSSDSNNSICDNSHNAKKDKNWEEILQDKLAYFANLAKESSVNHESSSKDAGLYRAQSCPGILGILMQTPPSSPVIVEPKNQKVDFSSVLRKKTSKTSGILDKFKNRYSCGSLEYTSQERECFFSPDSHQIPHVENCTNEKNSDENQPSSISPNHQQSFRRPKNSIIQVS